MTNTRPVLGIDPSSQHLTFAYGNLDGSGVKVIKHLLPSRNRHEYARTLMVGIIDQLNPVFVALEAPVLGRGGPGSTIPQCFVSGAAQAALEASGVAWELINNQTWKRVATGKGNANKLDIVSWVSAALPDVFGQCHTKSGLVDQDKCDAVGIYTYARKSYRLKKKLARNNPTTNKE